MNTNTHRIAALALAAGLGLLLPSIGRSQGPPPPNGNGGPAAQGMNRPTGGAPASTAQVQSVTVTIELLGMTSVQRDLAITAEQYAALSALAAKAQSTGLTEDAVRASAATILSAAQSARLTELLVQYLGYGSLAFADVRAKLELSEDQEARIADILTGLAAAKRAVVSTATTASALQRATAELQSSANARLAKVLTEDQDKRLRAQAGKPIGS